MALRAEIVIESPDRRRILVVECKRTQETSRQQAVRWRRNLVAHGLDSEVPYFLLAFPTGLFLWRANANIEAPPDFTAPAQGVLKWYLGPIADQPGGPLEESLEIAFAAWLSDLAHGVRQPDVLSEADVGHIRPSGENERWRIQGASAVMIVLVESNFVIEFAQRQAEIADAERIVTLAENREIELAIPACALFEPYETLVRRRKQRTGTVEQLGCKLFASFSNTRKYIENVAQRTHPLDS